VSDRSEGPLLSEVKQSLNSCTGIGRNGDWEKPSLKEETVVHRNTQQAVSGHAPTSGELELELMWGGASWIHLLSQAAGGFE